MATRVGDTDHIMANPTIQLTITDLALQEEEEEEESSTEVVIEQIQEVIEAEVVIEEQIISQIVDTLLLKPFLDPVPEESYTFDSLADVKVELGKAVDP